MGYEEIANIVSNLAFPIAACIYLARQNERWVTVISDVTNTLKAMELRLSEIETKINGKELKNDEH